MAPLAGQVVVVTGASSGPGREAAVQLAGRGCSVVLAASRTGAPEQVARACRERGGQALVVATDVTRGAEVSACSKPRSRRGGEWTCGSTTPASRRSGCSTRRRSRRSAA